MNRLLRLASQQRPHNGRYAYGIVYALHWHRVCDDASPRRQFSQEGQPARRTSDPVATPVRVLSGSQQQSDSLLTASSRPTLTSALFEVLCVAYGGPCGHAMLMVTASALRRWSPQLAAASPARVRGVVPVGWEARRGFTHDEADRPKDSARDPLKTDLLKLYKRVHPDLFHASPTQRVSFTPCLPGSRREDGLNHPPDASRPNLAHA